MFEEAGRRIGDEGLHKAWWRTRRRSRVDSTQAKLELVALSIDPTVRKRLETTARRQVGTWLRLHGSAINSLPERRRQVYDDVRAQASEPELRTVTFPQEITIAGSNTMWPRNVYADPEGLHPATLNKWEVAVLNEELERDTHVVWLRNLPRKPYSITVPFEVAGRAAPSYPDFIFLEQRDKRWVPSMLDPHHIDLADAPAKAVGLAKYADKHHPDYSRIELIIIRDDHISRLDLTDEDIRHKVLAVKTKEHLSLLFEEFS